MAAQMYEYGAGMRGTNANFNGKARKPVKEAIASTAPIDTPATPAVAAPVSLGQPAAPGSLNNTALGNTLLAKRGIGGVGVADKPTSILGIMGRDFVAQNQQLGADVSRAAQPVLSLTNPIAGAIGAPIEKGVGLVRKVTDPIAQATGETVARTAGIFSPSLEQGIRGVSEKAGNAVLAPTPAASLPAAPAAANAPAGTPVTPPATPAVTDPPVIGPSGDAMMPGALQGKATDLRPGEARFFDPRSGTNRQIDTRLMVDDRPAVGATTPQGGIILGRVGDRDAAGNVIERRSGIIGATPKTVRSEGVAKMRSDFEGPRKAAIPSHMERMTRLAGDIQGKNAVDLQREKGATDIRLGQINADAARTNAQIQGDIRRQTSADMLKGREIDATGRIAAAVAKQTAAMKPEDAKTFTAKADAITARIAELKSELKESSPGFLGFGGSKTKAAQIQQKIDDLYGQLYQHIGVVDQVDGAATAQAGIPGQAPVANQASPIKVSTRAERGKLPSGTRYVDPNGNIGIKQ